SRATRRGSTDAHPARPRLIVEVSASRSRLTFDRAHKGSLYARAGVADFWIVNLLGQALEVYRSPAPEDSMTFGWRYDSREVLPPDASVAPLAAPHASVFVRDLLP